MLTDLSSDDRLRLVRFVCSFAWADLTVNDAERAFVQDLVRRLGLSIPEAEEVEGWLAHPPRPESIDPAEIPLEHRQVFLDTVLALLGTDGALDAAEAESFNLLSQILR
jgi:uncharacterized membrane protein YebE (DUF533 family)